MDGESVCRVTGPAQRRGTTSQPARARSFQKFLFQLPAVLEPPVCFVFLARELRDHRSYPSFLLQIHFNAGLTEESVCPTLVRKGVGCGAGAFACQPIL